MKYKDNVRKQLIKRMLYSYLHSSKSKKRESLDSWEPAMVTTSLCGIYSLTLKITSPCKSLEWVSQSTLLTRHSWVAWVDAKESRRLRTWASASLKSRKKVAKESQSKHPFSFNPLLRTVVQEQHLAKISILKEKEMENFFMTDASMSQ